jgi:hypothetical protein
MASGGCSTVLIVFFPSIEVHSNTLNTRGVVVQRARVASKHVFCSVANTFVYCLTASIMSYGDERLKDRDV